MTLFLHELAHSPFCIPVKRILEAWSIPFETRQVSAWDRRALIELTGGAYYQVPVLEYGDRIVHETADDLLSVAHFLDEEFCNGALFPDDCAGLQELVIEHIETTLEGKGFKLSDPRILDEIEDLGERIMVARHKERGFGPGCVNRWREGATALAREFESALEPYERRLGHLPFLFGERPVYADFALFGVVGNAEFGGHYQLPPTFQNLLRWQSAMKRHADS
jgi:glutathione S-transferase